MGESEKGYEALIKDQTATSKQVKEAKDKMEASEKTYKELGGVTGSALTKQEKAAEKQKKNKKRQPNNFFHFTVRTNRMKST